MNDLQCWYQYTCYAGSYILPLIHSFFTDQTTATIDQPIHQKASHCQDKDGHTLRRNIRLSLCELNEWWVIFNIDTNTLFMLGAIPYHSFIHSSLFELQLLQIIQYTKKHHIVKTKTAIPSEGTSGYRFVS